MTRETIIDLLFKAMPIIATGVGVYGPQYINALKKRGGWWAIGAGGLVFAWQAAYYWYTTYAHG